MEGTLMRTYLLKKGASVESLLGSFEARAASPLFDEGSVRASLGSVQRRPLPSPREARDSFNRLFGEGGSR